MLKHFEFAKKHYKEYQKILVDLTNDLIELKKVSIFVYFRMNKNYKWKFKIF
jgi:hypothetical protein